MFILPLKLYSDHIIEAGDSVFDRAQKRLVLPNTIMSDPQLNPEPSPSLKERILLNQKIANCLGESIEAVHNLSAADKAYYIDAFNLEITQEEKDNLATKVPCYTARVREETPKTGKRKRITCFDSNDEKDDDFIVDKKQSSIDADLMNLYSRVPSGSGRVRRKAAINASKKMTLNEGEINEALISESSTSANHGKDECIDVDNDNLTQKPNVSASNATEELNEKYADTLSHINSYFKKPVLLNHIRPVEKIFAEMDFPLLDPSKIVAPDTCPDLEEFPSLTQHMNTIR